MVVPAESATAVPGSTSCAARAAMAAFSVRCRTDFASNPGSSVEPGPATVWLRMRQPLVAGEEPTPLQRALVVADVGNGVSATLDFRRFLFINVDLTVQLERMPAGEWICIDAVTLPQPHGVGTTESVLFDREGRIGRGLQTLLISER